MATAATVATTKAAERAPYRMPPRAVVQTAIRARSALLRLADRLLPAHVSVLEHAHAFTRPYLLVSMVELGVADELAKGPRSAAELARAVGADADALHRVLRAAATVGLVRLDRAGRFHATRLTRPLQTGDSYALGDWCRYLTSPSLQQAWHGLPEAVRTGDSPFRRTHGMDVFSWFAEHVEEGSHFSRGLGGLTLLDAPMVCATYPFPDQGVVCDVGGGAGVLLGEILQSRPGLRGVLVDSAAVLQDASAYLMKLGVDDRAELVEGDFLSLLTPTADIYLLKWVLHDWDDETCVRIITNIATAMPAGSRLVVIEGDQPRTQVHPRYSMIDAQMLVVSDGGRERSAAELEELLRASGLTSGPVRRTPTDVLLVEAVRRPTR
jgi:hypothetical protein